MSVSPGKSRETSFWDWFQRNEAELFRIDSNQESLIRLVVRELHRIHPSLTCEISSVHEGKRQFIISADGKRDAFPAVVQLADAAPSLNRWEVIKFRPRRSEPCLIGIGNAQFSSSEVQFTLEPEEGKVGVTLYFGDGKSLDEQAIGHIGFLLLDYTLGEYDVETFVGSVQFKPLDAAGKKDKHFLPELPRRFDALVKSLAN